jgi:hypothetical protein
MAAHVSLKLNQGLIQNAPPWSPMGGNNLRLGSPDGTSRIIGGIPEYRYPGTSRKAIFIWEQGDFSAIPGSNLADYIQAIYPAPFDAMRADSMVHDDGPIPCPAHVLGL